MTHTCARECILLMSVCIVVNTYITGKPYGCNYCTLLLCVHVGYIRYYTRRVKGINNRTVHACA